MASFNKGGALRTPFGKNNYLRDTHDVTDVIAYTVAASTITAVTLDSISPAQKILQPGTVMAKITSGADSGKVGPFQGQAGTTVTDGRQTLTNIVGINDTFLPWQLLNRDVEIGVCYEADVVQGWCFEYDNAGNLIALTNATAAAMVAQKTMNFLFF